MPLSRDEFEYLRGLLRQQAAIVLDDGKEYLAETRLQALACRAGLGSTGELVQAIRLDPGHELRDKVVEAMTTNETLFFRDVAHFDQIRDQLIPEILRRRGPSRPLRIWSAACSSGQEPYSLAISIRERFPEACGGRLSLIASDISAEMIERCKLGRYSQFEVNRGVPVAHLVRYFQRRGLDWYVDDSIRQMVDFRVVNLARPWPAFPAPDLVLLRNVLIYFDAETRRDVLDRVARVMAPDGFLVLGGSESPIFVSDAFERISRAGAAAYQLKGARARDGEALARGDGPSTPPLARIPHHPGGRRRPDRAPGRRTNGSHQ